MKRKICLAVLLLICIGGILCLLQKKKSLQVQAADSTSDTQGILYQESSAQNIQENIAQNIIRLHVIANSDSDADQSQKLMVRDEIIGSLQDALKDVDTIAQAKETIASHQTDIETAAKRVLTSLGSDASVKVSLENRYFPVKQYGDFIFPAGTYQALCVELGKAEGRNWWCVLFPSLCFVDETTAAVPDASKEKLKEHLSEEAYQSLESGAGSATDASSNAASDVPESTAKPQLHFGILDWFTK